MCSSISNNPPEDIFDLFNPFSQENIPLIYEKLSRSSGTFSPVDAHRLIAEALRENLSLEIVEAILEHSPPVPEILSPDNAERYVFTKKTAALTNSFGLVNVAAFLDRADVLSLLIERGASPNQSYGFNCPPLLAALWGESPKSVECLMRQPELDTAWTPPLLYRWAQWEGYNPGLDACILAMAPRFTGWDPGSGQPLPIPEPMTPDLIAGCWNWPLLERFCRERCPVPPDDAREAVRTMISNGYPEREDLQTAFAGSLAALLESCPDLLAQEKYCRTLLRYFFRFCEAARACLRPRAECLHCRRFAMDWEDWSHVGEFIRFPDIWQRLLPHGPTLVVDRWDDIWVSELFDRAAEPRQALIHILNVCPVEGKGRKGELSPLAQVALRCGDLSLISRLLRQSDGLLATEDPGALLDFVIQGNCPRATRAAVLSHVHKEMDYDL